MSDFLYQELMAEEDCNYKMAEAAAHNQYASLSESKIKLFQYWLLAKMGKKLENKGSQMRQRYESLIMRAERNAFPSPVK